MELEYPIVLAKYLIDVDDIGGIVWLLKWPCRNLKGYIVQMRYIVSGTTHTASNLAVQLIIGANRYVDGSYITSKHVHAYLWPRVPNMGCFWKIFILKAGIAVSIRSVSFSVFELRLARMQELRLDDNKADT